MLSHAHYALTCTLCSHMHTMLSHAHYALYALTCTLCSHMHTMLSHAHYALTCTLCSHMHTMLSHAHYALTCALCSHMHTMLSHAHYALYALTCTLCSHMRTLCYCMRTMFSCAHPRSVFLLAFPVLRNRTGAPPRAEVVLHNTHCLQNMHAHIHTHTHIHTHIQICWVYVVFGRGIAKYTVIYGVYTLPGIHGSGQFDKNEHMFNYYLVQVRAPPCAQTLQPSNP